MISRGPQHVEFLIIGAGPTGLGAALRLQELECTSFLVLERLPHVGGLASSFVDANGFTWDLGSHLQHSHYQKFDEYMALALEPEEWVEHRRNTWIWHEGRFVPYPFQLNLHRLQESEKWRCVEGLLKIQDPERQYCEAKDFKSWCLATFGDGISSLFMLPYNEKIWARPADKLGNQWIRDRVAIPSLAEVLKGICLNCDSTDWGPNAMFRYPKHGGTGAIWTRLAAQLDPGNTILNEGITSIDVQRKIAVTSTGACYRYEHLVSSMPLDLLVSLLGDPPELQTVAKLRKNTTHVIGLGIKGPMPECLAGQFWGYYAQSDVPFYRLTVMSNLSASTVPSSAHWSLMAEVSESEFVARPYDLVASTEAAVRRLELLPDSSAIVSRWHQRLGHGYPVPTHDRDLVVDRLLERLSALQIHSRGRFGAWKYEVSNQDHSFMQGVEVIDRIVHGHCELTRSDPNLVNSRYNTFPPQEWANAATAQNFRHDAEHQ